MVMMTSNLIAIMFGFLFLGLGYGGLYFLCFSTGHAETV